MKAVNFNSHISIILICLLIVPLHAALGDSLSTPPTEQYPGIPLSNQSLGKPNADAPYNSPQKFRKYMKEEYNDIHEANARVENTLHGPAGRIYVIGKIAKPDEVILEGVEDKHARARLIAKAFIKKEKALFGVSEPEEILEHNTLDSSGIKGEYTIIYYKRYVNGIEVADSDADVVVGQDGNITSFSASLVPVPDEAYLATKQKTLSQEEVRSIAEDDLRADPNTDFARDLKLEADSSRREDKIVLRRSYKKVVITTAPYVVWKVGYYCYDYTIDAFSGKILSKENIIHGFPKPKIPK